MKAQMKLAAKHLIRSAAATYKITPRQVLQMFQLAGTYDGSKIQNFGILLQMCAKSIPTSGPADFSLCHDLLNSQSEIDRCTYLYHTIDNFYYREISSYAEFSTYPRLEDLFASKPAEEFVKSVTSFAITKFTWNSQQQKALNKIYKWLRQKDRPQIFRLFGYAGTGKSELSKAVADFVMNEQGKGNVPSGNVLFAAYSGKACSVMRTKGCRGADTLHSLLYKPIIDPETGACKEFVLNGESPIVVAALLIVDEVSMVNDEMARDILGFGTPVLVLGDPEQLPPIKGEGFFIQAEPNVMLTSIERQAEENPIIYLATRARQGLEIKPGRYGESVVYSAGKHVSDEMYADHSQVLCGLNSTRKTINSRSRRINGKALKDPMYPVKGDKLICLRNNRTLNLYNGTLWTSSKHEIRKILRPAFKGSTLMKSGDLDVLAFKIRSLDEVDANGKPYILDTQCSLHFFNQNIPEPPFRDLIGSDEWDFGYGMTTHKAQGSQFDSLLAFDESQAFRQDRHKHRYTQYTRAASRITILL